jgi:hypothetical protein
MRTTLHSLVTSLRSGTFTPKGTRDEYLVLTSRCIKNAPLLMLFNDERHKKKQRLRKHPFFKLQTSIR